MDAYEIGNLILRLTGDTGQFEVSLTRVQDAVKQTGVSLAKVAHDVDGFGKTLTRFGEASVAGLGLFGAEEFLRKSFAMFGETETALIKLTAAIKGNGGSVEETVKQYKDFAKVQKDVNGASVDETLGLLKKAEAFGLTGDAAERAVSNSMKMAAAADVDAASALRVTKEMEKGDIKKAMMYSRAIPQLRGVRDETEFLTIANRLFSQGQETQLALMNSTEGVMKRFWGTLKGIQKQFGEMVAEAVVPVVKEVTKLLKAFLGLDENTKRLVVSAAFLATGFLMIGPAIAKTSAVWVPLFRMMADGFQIVNFLVLQLLHPITLLKHIFTGLSVALGVLFSPWAIIIGLAAAAVAVFVVRMGGIKPALDKVAGWAAVAWKAMSAWALEAWEKVKVYATIAWDWIQQAVDNFLTWGYPIFMAYVGVLQAGWEFVKEVAVAVWDFISGVVSDAIDYWTNLFDGWFGGYEMAWKWIQQVTTTVLLMIEFGLRNMGRVFQWLGAGIALDSVRAWNSVHDGFIILAAGVVGGVKALGAVFGVFWDFFVDSAAYGIKKVMAHFAGLQAMVEAGLALEDPLAAYEEAYNKTLRDLGATSVNRMGDVGAASARAFSDGYNSTVRALGGLNSPQLEAELRREFQRLGGLLGEDLDTFIARRMREIGTFQAGGGSTSKAAAERAGQGLGEAFNHGLGKEMKKFDSVLRFSADALKRISEYRDMLRGDKNLGAAEASRALLGGGTAVPAVPANLPGDANLPGTLNRPGVELPEQLRVPPSIPQETVNRFVDIAQALEDLVPSFMSGAGRTLANFGGSRQEERMNDIVQGVQELLPSFTRLLTDFGGPESVSQRTLRQLRLTPQEQLGRAQEQIQGTPQIFSLLGASLIQQVQGNNDVLGNLLNSTEAAGRAGDLVGAARAINVTSGGGTTFTIPDRGGSTAPVPIGGNNIAGSDGNNTEMKQLLMTIRDTLIAMSGGRSSVLLSPANLQE